MRFRRRLWRDCFLILKILGLSDTARQRSADKDGPLMRFVADLDAFVPEAKGEQDLLHKFNVEVLQNLDYYETKVGTLLWRRRLTKIGLVVALTAFAAGAIALFTQSSAWPFDRDTPQQTTQTTGGRTDSQGDQVRGQGAKVAVQPDELDFEAVSAVSIAVLIAVLMMLRFFASLSDDNSHLAHYWRARAEIAGIRYSLIDVWKGGLIEGRTLPPLFKAQLRHDILAARAVVAAEKEAFFTDMASTVELLDGAIRLLRGLGRAADHSSRRLERLREERDELLDRDRLVAAGGVFTGRAIHAVVARPDDKTISEIPARPDREACRNVLPGAVNSAAIIQQLGYGGGFFPSVLLNNCSSEQLSAEIDRLIKEHQKNSEKPMGVLLSFHGHGALSEDGNEALLCLENSLYDGATLAKKLLAFNQQVKIIIFLDCCHAQGFLQASHLDQAAGERDLETCPTIDIIAASQIQGITLYKNKPPPQYPGGMFSVTVDAQMARQPFPTTYCVLKERTRSPHAPSDPSHLPWPPGRTPRTPFEA